MLSNLWQSWERCLSLIFFPKLSYFWATSSIAFKADWSITLDFAKSRVIDQSALKAIEDVAQKYDSFGKKIKLRHLSQDCHKLLSKTGQLIVDNKNDPKYSLAVDYGVNLKIFNK